MGVTSSIQNHPAYSLIIETRELQNPRSLVSCPLLCGNIIQGRKETVIDFPNLQLSDVKKLLFKTIIKIIKHTSSEFGQINSSDRSFKRALQMRNFSSSQFINRQ